MSPYRRNLLVGATVLGALVIFVWMMLKFGGKTAAVFASPGMDVHFNSTRADGLSDGSPILFLGVDVGHVSTVSRTADGKSVHIDAYVDRSPPLPANVEAQIVQTSALGGGSSIELQMQGPEERGTLTPGTTLEAKYVGLRLALIPPSIVEAASQVGNMSAQIARLSKELSDSTFVPDLDNTVRNINDKVTKVGQVLDSVQSVMGDEKTQTDLKTAIANFKETSQSATVVAAKLDKLADSLQKGVDEANGTVRDVHHDSDAITKQIGDRLTQISTVLTNMESVTQKLDTGKGTAGQLVNDPRLYEALVDSSRELDATVKDLKRLVDQWEQEGVTLKLK